jgi:hypothetical protein
MGAMMTLLSFYELGAARDFIVKRTRAPGDVVEIVLLNFERYLWGLGLGQGVPGARESLPRLRERHMDLFAPDRLSRRWRWPTEQAEFVHRETGYARPLIARVVIAELEYLAKLDMVASDAVEPARLLMADWEAKDLEDTQPCVTLASMPSAFPEIQQ